MSTQNKTQNGRKATGQTTGEIIFFPNIKALMFQYSLHLEDVICKFKSFAYVNDFNYTWELV